MAAINSYCDLDLCDSVLESGNGDMLVTLQIVEIKLMDICRTLKPCKVKNSTVILSSDQGRAW